MDRASSTFGMTTSGSNEDTRPLWDPLKAKAGIQGLLKRMRRVNSIHGKQDTGAHKGSMLLLKWLR